MWKVFLGKAYPSLLTYFLAFKWNKVILKLRKYKAQKFGSTVKGIRHCTVPPPAMKAAVSTNNFYILAEKATARKILLLPDNLCWFCPCCTWLSCSCSLQESFIAAWLWGDTVPSCTRRSVTPAETAWCRGGGISFKNQCCASKRKAQNCWALSRGFCLSSSVHKEQNRTPGAASGGGLGWPGMLCDPAEPVWLHQGCRTCCLLVPAALLCPPSAGMCRRQNSPCPASLGSSSSSAGGREQHPAPPPGEPPSFPTTGSQGRMQDAEWTLLMALLLSPVRMSGDPCDQALQPCWKQGMELKHHLASLHLNLCSVSG